MPTTRRGARVTTRTGDRGDTSLFGPGRVRKSDPRIEALGALDEAQAALGVARALARGKVRERILGLQRGLYLAMSEVATPTARLARLPERLDASKVSELDAFATELLAATEIGGRFVVPGEDPLSAALDVARTVIRRAERRVVSLADARAVQNEHVLPWLNRLSDVAFLLARAVERRPKPAARASRGARRA